MIIYANAKINLGLQITGKRADGYHLLESVFIPIPLVDIIEITEHHNHNQDTLNILGNIETGPVENNLIIRAVKALRDIHDFPAVQITLKKQIPSGAGMGGGSSDATHTLKALRDLFQLPISNIALEQLSLSLGADCPFFVDNTPKLVRGIGEIFKPIPSLKIRGLYIVVIKPNIHISTADAFKGLKRIGGHTQSIEEIIQQDVHLWRDYLHNDFEDSLFPIHPELTTLKEKLYDLGAIYASMTGSGAALYGLFNAALSPQELNIFSEIFCWQSYLE